MPRYIFIDTNSGYAFGDFRAETISDAAAMMDRDVNPHQPPRTYEFLGHDPRNTRPGFLVYDATLTEIPKIEDGQDQELVKRVESQAELIGFLETIADEEHEL